MKRPPTATPASALTLVDDYTSHACSGYRLIRVYCSSTRELLRVRVHDDTYIDQSHAVAEVMTPARTWTLLLEDPPDQWHRTLHAGPTGRQARQRTLTAIADSLADRADALLAVAPEHHGSAEGGSR